MMQSANCSESVGCCDKTQRSRLKCCCYHFRGQECFPGIAKIYTEGILASEESYIFLPFLLVFGFSHLNMNILD